MSTHGVAAVVAAIAGPVAGGDVSALVAHWRILLVLDLAQLFRGSGRLTFGFSSGIVGLFCRRGGLRRGAVGERDVEPAEDVIHQGLGDGDVRVIGVAAWLEPAVREFAYKGVKRNAILEA